MADTHSVIKTLALVFAGVLYIAWIVSVVNLTALLLAIVISTGIMMPINILGGRPKDDVFKETIWAVFGATTLIGIIETLMKMLS